MAILGRNTTGDGDFPGSVDRCLLTKFTSIEAGTITLAGLRGALNFAPDSFKIVVFDDDGGGGEPGTLLYVGPVLSYAAPGFQTGAMSGSIVAKDYWIGAVALGGGYNWGENTGGGETRMANGTFSYASPPSTWPGTDGSYSIELDVYLEYTPSGGGIEVDAADTITFSDSAVSISQRLSVGSDTITFSDSGVSISQRLSVGSDTLTFSDTAVSISVRISVGEDTITFTDSGEAATGVPVGAADTITFSDSAAAAVTLPVEASDTLSFTDSAVSVSERLSVGEDTLTMSDSALSGVTNTVAAEDTLTVSDSAEAVTTSPSEASDTLVTSDSAVATLVPAGESFAADTIVFSDSADSFSSLSATASDSIFFSDSAVVQGDGVGPVQGPGVSWLYKVQGRGVQGTGVPGVLQ